MSYCFSDRYDEIKIIYQSAATKVTLVSSKNSDELLLMKCVMKQPDSSPTNFLEADLLQMLHHPGIPSLIDRYEDDSVYVIVEEFISGEPLEQYLLYHQHISLDTFIQFAMQLCEIVYYLHSQQPNPVLYLDLKPNHIIVCGNRLNLIDYGNANILSSSGNTFQKFGTKKYAAPEQLQGRKVDQRTDVYGVGKMLCLMAKYTPFPTRWKLKPILFRATRYSMEKRTPDMAALQSQLQGMAKKPKKKHGGQRHLLQKIAVVGSEHGVGCTHIAITLVCYLNQAGCSAYYRNETKQQVVEQLLKQNMTCRTKDGIIYHDAFRGLITYGPGIEKTNPPDFVQVIDCGYVTEKPDAGATIYVCGGAFWQRKNAFPPWVDEHTIILCNHFDYFQGKTFARQINHKVYIFPYHRNVFYPSAAVRALFFRIFRKDILL